MAELRIPIIVENKGKKALKDVDKGIKGVASSFKKLAGAAGIGLSVAAVINFGKQSVKAFAENEKSAKRLAGVVRNLGLELETPLIEANLDSISAKYGYQGEVLREAFQKLITTTGSLTKSQDLLNASLSISAGSGVDLVTVNQDLANLYIGNTKGLKKYNLGLSNAQLKTLKFEDAVTLLNKQFRGAAADELKTYSGKMRVLGEAAGNAQEIIGEGLVDSLMILTGDTDIDGLARSMKEFAEQAADAATSIASIIKDIKGNKTVQIINEAAWMTIRDIFSGEIFSLTPKGSIFNPDTPKVGRARRFFAGGQDSVLEAKRNKERAAAEAEALRLARERANLEKKAAMDAKKKAMLEKAARTLELQRINIAAGLRGKISETDKLSLQLQLALLNENDTQAEKLSKQLEEAVKRQKELSAALLATPKAPNPYEDWKIPVLGMISNNVTPNDYSDYIDTTTGKPNFPSSTSSSSGDTVVNVEVKVAGEDVAAIITQQQTNQSLSGSFVNVNRLGRFAETPTI